MIINKIVMEQLRLELIANAQKHCHSNYFTPAVHNAYRYAECENLTLAINTRKVPINSGYNNTDLFDCIFDQLYKNWWFTSPIEYIYKQLRAAKNHQGTPLISTKCSRDDFARYYREIFKNIYVIHVDNIYIRSNLRRKILLNDDEVLDELSVLYHDLYNTIVGDNSVVDEAYEADFEIFFKIIKPDFTGNYNSTRGVEWFLCTDRQFRRMYGRTDEQILYALSRGKIVQSLYRQPLIDTIQLQKLITVLDG